VGEGHPDFATALDNLATLYRLVGDYAAAQPLYRQALQIRARTIGEEHPDFAASLSNLGLLCRLMGNYTEAEAFLRQALKVRREALGEEHPDLAASLNNLALLSESMGNYAAAEPLLLRARDILQSSLGPDHPTFASSLNNVAHFYESVGNYAAAEPLYHQALEIRRRALGEEHPDFAASLRCLARLHDATGNYLAAVDLYRRAGDILGSALGEEHPYFVTNLGDLALTYRSMGNYAAAEPLLLEALEKTRRALGEGHPDFATSLSNLGWLYESMGKQAAAEPLLRRALEIRRKALGEMHADFATSLYSVAALCDSRGDYVAAEPLYRQALEIWRNSLGGHHPNIAASLGRRADLYRRMGNYGAAEHLNRQALEIEREIFGEEHHRFACALSTLGILYELTGNYGAAEPLLRQALEISRKTRGETHPDFAVSLTNLGLLCRLMGKYVEAEPLHRQAMEILRTALGAEHPAFANSLVHLAEFYRSMGNYAEAEPLNKQALEIYRKVMGENHLDFAVGLNSLAMVYAATGRENEALALMLHAATIEDKMIGQVFSIASESQRMAYIDSIQRNLDSLLSLISDYLPGNTEAVQAGFDLVLRHKAIGAEALAAQRDAVLGGKYPGLEPALRELTTLRMQIAQKTLAGPGVDGVEVHRNQLAEWTNRRERLEADLARQIPEMNAAMKLRTTDRHAVALALPERTVLVEFVRFAVLDFKAVPCRGEPKWKPARFLAFAMRAGEPDIVHMIDLGEADAIDKMIATFRAGITGEAENHGSQDTQSCETLLTNPNQVVTLRETLFDPLLTALGGHKRVLIAPDGDLSRLPFEVLPARDGGRLIDEYHISYLGTGRDALRFREATSGRPSAPLVLADPDLDLGRKELSAASSGRSQIDLSAPKVKAGLWSGLFARQRVAQASPSAQPVRSATPVGRKSRDLDPRTLHFESLPGTRVEGEQVAEMLGVRPWLGEAALEAPLKACKSPRILHLATHGFFLRDQKRDRNEEPSETIDVPGDEPGRMLGARLENPMLRSGLILAGFNTWCRGEALPPEAEDGLLTAEDVSGLNLLDTDLVVLSACETGLGEVGPGRECSGSAERSRWPERKGW
jgi:tetratricopeptide (TPR) repeat protein